MATAYSQASSHLAAPMNRYVRNLILTRLVVVLVARTTSCAPRVARRQRGAVSARPSARGRRRAAGGARPPLADRQGQLLEQVPDPFTGLK
jgi:hypothetical protein